MEKTLCIFLSPGNAKENPESQQSVRQKTLKIDLTAFMAPKVTFLVDRKLLFEYFRPEGAKWLFVSKIFFTFPFDFPRFEKVLRVENFYEHKKTLV